ncbi:hypothetical protein BST81_26675 [Leptolyngbya sp. 'hensonii']|uniref:hypothetical protein n=1 Tax=Leptolyngbya sp. 'hensonii' TaxID=1922337 RepID=UPI00094FEE54|nr:hypothetical protein [Leptolyngbya sp. 'hensonii']OLP15374.1 hypothetical protein BST81_26675 [Leptolyngbya sp. 'hensonii']
MIAVVGGQKNPRKTWKRLCERYPEVVAKCYNLKFPGAGQRETPVTDRQGWAQVLGLLPGIAGATYRQEVADLVLRYLDADINVAVEIVDRNNSDEDLERLEVRIRGKKIRNQLTRTLSYRGVIKPLDYALSRSEG